MFIYNNTDILNPDDARLRPMNGYGMTNPYGRQTGLRPLSGLGSYVDDVVRDTGGLEPGQRITFDQAKYLYSGGQSKRNPEQYAYLRPDVPGAFDSFGGLEGFLDYYQSMLLRLTASKKADDAYADYLATRATVAPEAAAMLVWDANGRATDESVAAANEYGQYTAPAVAQAYEKLQQATANYENTVASIQAAGAAAAAAAAVVPTYTDAELSQVIQQRLIDQAQLPGEVVNYLVNTMKVDVNRANALVNAEFAVVQNEYVAAQTAKRQAQEAEARRAQQAAQDAETARQAKAAADFYAKQAEEARAALAKAQADAAKAIADLKAKATAVPGTPPTPGTPVTPPTPGQAGIGPLLLTVAAAYILGA